MLREIFIKTLKTDFYKFNPVRQRRFAQARNGVFGQIFSVVVGKIFQGWV